MLDSYSWKPKNSTAPQAPNVSGGVSEQAGGHPLTDVRGLAMRRISKWIAFAVHTYEIHLSSRMIPISAAFRCADTFVRRAISSRLDA